MSLFTPKPSLETRLAEAETNLTTAKTSLTTMTTERDAANARVGELEKQLSEANVAREKIEQIADELKDGFVKEEAAAKALSALNSQLSTVLDLKPEEVAALDERKLKAEIETLAGKKAIDIAASQGAPAIHTDPARVGDGEDEVKLAFETAASETDPLKRGQMFAKASAMLSKKPSGLN